MASMSAVVWTLAGLIGPMLVHVDFAFSQLPKGYERIRQRLVSGASKMSYAWHEVPFIDVLLVDGLAITVRDRFLPLLDQTVRMRNSGHSSGEDIFVVLGVLVD